MRCASPRGSVSWVMRSPVVDGVAVHAVLGHVVVPTTTPASVARIVRNQA